MKKITLYRFLLISLAAVMGIGGTVRAETPPIKAELLTPVQQRMQQEVSVDFRETPIEDVLRILAKQADVDIIKSPKVIGTVTATLTDVPLSEALENILASQGYSFVTTTNMIRVIPKEELTEAREKQVSRVYRVTYADVKEVEAALKKFISQEGSISSNPGTSNIIVTDSESKINAINSFIEEIDRVTPQILVEAKVYDITSKDNFDLGVQWNAGTATSYGAIPTGATLGSGYSSLGNVLYGNTTSGFGTVTNPYTTGAFSGTTDNATATDALMRFGILNEHINIDAALRAAQEDIRAKLLASPRIMVLDNQQAEIKIVEEVPYQELTETSGGGNIGTTQFREVGVELRVIPHLTREGLIRLILNPKFSAQTGRTLSVTGGGNTSPQPIVAKREATTTALIKDGQTVVIGGLKKQDVSQQINKIPLLGDLPLLGLLFRFRGESTVNSELVVFITPAVVNTPVLTESEQRYLKDTVFETPRIPEIPYGKKKPEKKGSTITPGK
jgi:type IV pilus secretin PilQ/predicted competence protein